MNIILTAEQQKALLTEYTSIEEYCQRVVENRANRIMQEIIKNYADNLKGVTVDEQTTIDTVKGKITVNAENLPDDVKKIIVRRAKTKTMVQKISEQEII